MAVDRPPLGASGGWVRRLWPFMAAHRRKMAVALAGSLLGQGANALTPLVQKVAVDDAIVERTRPLGGLIALLVLLGVVSFVAAFVRRSIGNAFGLAVQRDLSQAVFHHLERLDLETHDRVSGGDLVSRATADITLVQTLLSQLHVILGNLTLLVVGIAAMLWLSPPLTALVVLVLPALALLAGRLRRRLFPSLWYDQQALGALTGTVERVTDGAHLVRAFAQEERETATFADQAELLARSRLRTARLRARYAPAIDQLPGLGQLVVLVVGGWMTIGGHLSVGTFLAFATYMVQLSSPVRTLSGVLTTAQQARAGATRVLELLDIEPRVVDEPGAVPLRAPHGRIEFDGVRFAYPGGQALLDGFDLTVEPGERVAIVGPAGSGKSTLAMLLTRLYDVTGGRIVIDGTDVRSATLDSLRRAVGLAFEDSFLFADTVAGNIAYGVPDADRARIEQAAALAGAHDFIAQLPQGYDTPVAELGRSLSGGQRQRIALARALLTRPAILVLDDATSAIDARTEGVVLGALDAAFGTRTTILIAHRLSTIRLADRVVLLDHGHVVADGPHEHLLATSPRYRELLHGTEVEHDLDPSDGTDAIDEDALAGPPTLGDPWPADAPAPRSTTTRFQGASAGFSARSLSVNPAALAAAQAADLDAAVAALPPLPQLPGARAEATAPGGTPSFRRILGDHRRALAACVALLLIDTATTLALPVLVRWGIDHGVAEGSRGTVVATGAVLLGVLALAWINGMALIRLSAAVAERILLTLRVRGFAHLQRLSVDFFDRERSGAVTARVTTDVEALAQLLNQGLLMAFTSALTAVGVLGVLAVLDWRLALAAGAVVPVLVVATELFRRNSRRAHERSRERVAAVYANLHEGIAGVKVTKAMAREGRDTERFGEVASGYFSARVASARLAAAYFPFVSLLAIVAKAIVLGVAAGLVADGHLTVGVLVAFLLYLDQFFSPLQQLGQVFDQSLQAGVAVRRLEALAAEQPGTPAPADPRPVPADVGRFALEGAAYTYPGSDRPALGPVTLTIGAGERVAVIGATGAGKSTLAKLLIRFYDPTAGRVTAGGVPLTDLAPGAYRSRVGYVPQEPRLFPGTVADNIAYGRPDADRPAIERAAHAVGADAAICSLAHGYLTPVDERGGGLSAGQRQLICLARAALVDPALLLLDEATASLDAGSDAKVSQAVDAVATGRTTVVIAHRLQTARRADRVIVLDDGLVVEDGPPDELLDAEGPFAALWAASTGNDASTVRPGGARWPQK